MTTSIRCKVYSKFYKKSQLRWTNGQSEAAQPQKLLLIKYLFFFIVIFLGSGALSGRMLLVENNTYDAYYRQG